MPKGSSFVLRHSFVIGHSVFVIQPRTFRFDSPHWDRSMPLTLDQYAESLTKKDLVWPAPPTPQPVKAKPHLVEMPDVRVVAWNVYGTLLSISTGSLVFQHPQKLIMDVALDKTVQEFKMWGSMSRKPGQPSEYMGQLY